MRLFELEADTQPAPEEGLGPEPETSFEAAPTGPLRRVRMLVAYDGAPFHGFAAQPGQVTVSGRLAAALGRVTGFPVRLTCAGRTDAGVHAAGQVVHADLPEDFVESLDRRRLAASLTHQVGPEIAVLDVAPAAPGFDARRSALSRCYRYLLLSSPVPDPLLRSTSWHLSAPLELPAMRLAADALLGEHDFSAFCRRPPAGRSTVRRVTRADLEIGSDPRLIVFWIEANAFCHQMVRSIVGLITSAGEGRLTAADVLSILRSGDRSRSTRLAPPSGLCLMWVRYPESLVPGGVWTAGEDRRA